MQGLQPCLRNMRVNLRGGKIGVPQQHLHHAQVGAVIQQMRGKGVTQGVGRQHGLDSANSRKPFEVVPERLARHGPAARGDE